MLYTKIITNNADNGITVLLSGVLKPRQTHII